VNLNKTEALEIITAANPHFFASVDDTVLNVTKNSVLAGALVLINTHKPLIKRGALTLKGGETRYAAPGDAIKIIGSDYGIHHLKHFQPGHASYPRGIPSAYLDHDDQGPHIRLSNAVPGSTQRFVGTLLGYDYQARYKIDSDDLNASNVPHTLQPVIEAASQVETARRHILAAQYKTVGDGHKNKGVISPEIAHGSLLKAFQELTVA
jgi:hypothetical protein